MKKQLLMALGLGLILVGGDCLAAKKDAKQTQKNQKKSKGKSKKQKKKSNIKQAEAVLMSMNGKPVITQKSLDADFDQLVKYIPQAQKMSESESLEKMKGELFKAQVNQAIVRRYVQEKGYRKKPEYISKRALLMRSLEDSLDDEFFLNSFGANNSELGRVGRDQIYNTELERLKGTYKVIVHEPTVGE